MRTLALIARRPELDRDSFRHHYEQEHVPLALPLLEGLTRYVRNHVVASLVGEPPAFDVLTEFSYRDSGAFEGVLDRLASPAGESIARDELQFMDKQKNVFFGVEAWAGSGAEDPPETEKVALLAMRRPEDERKARMAHFEDFLQQTLVSAQGWRLWETRKMGSEPPVEAVAFVWFKPGAIDVAALADLDSVLGKAGTALRVDAFRSERPAD
ncbi:MAG: EthD domain-containing protein [Myxococcota bacterium]|nr:EthD domain-containing protein [Myxococcota bacterium]